MNEEAPATHYAYTAPYSHAPAVAAAAAAEETLASFSANNYRYMESAMRPYELTGPLASKARPDVWAVYNTARANKYEVTFDPGLVIRLGRPYGMYREWYVIFGHKYHQRFLMATSEKMLCTNLDEFLQWLRDHPF